MDNLRKRNVSKIDSPYALQQEKKVQTVAKRKQGLLRRLIMLAIFAAVVSSLIISTLVSQASVIDQKAEQKKELTNQLADLKKKQENLKEEVVKLNDDDYIAKLARRDYFLSNKGEIIFNLPKKKEDSDSY